MTNPTADFQREIFSMTEDKNLDLSVITAFRGSAKSTICATSLPIWAVIGGRAHYVVIASQTRQQARQHLANIKIELETNELLKNDLGPFESETDEWGAFALTFKDYDAKIIAVSTEQAFRGTRYKQYRPSLIVADDIEDLNSTKTQESRDKIYSWFTSEIIPLGTPETKIIVLGNFLHEYSLVGKLMMQIQNGQRKGVFKRYPLINEQGECNWTGMYPNNKAIDEFKKKIGDEATWQREYQLTIISSNSKLIPLDWIKIYDKLPSRKEKTYEYTWSAADLAIGKNENNDCTAIVSAQVHCHDDDLKIYILPNPVNQQLDFSEAIEAMKLVLNQPGHDKLFVESTGFQEAYYQYMLTNGYSNVEGVKVSADKHTRLALTTKLIKEGNIVFPKEGAQELITQLVGFGKERHDDLADAFSMLIQKILEQHKRTSGVRAWMRWVEKRGSCWI